MRGVKIFLAAVAASVALARADDGDSVQAVLHRRQGLTRLHAVSFLTHTAWLVMFNSRNEGF